MLGMVMFSVVLGACIGKMKEAGRPLQGLFETLSEAMMIITSWVIWMSPVGVFFLVAAKLLEMASFMEVLGQLGWYFMTVMLGLFLHGFGKEFLVNQNYLLYVTVYVILQKRHYFGNLLLGNAEAYVPLYRSNGPSTCHCFWYWIQLSHHADYDSMLGQYGH